jgi:hypothetical protein
MCSVRSRLRIAFKTNWVENKTSYVSFNEPFEIGLIIRKCETREYQIF